jgi:hypothetical protein
VFLIELQYLQNNPGGTRISLGRVCRHDTISFFWLGDLAPHHFRRGPGAMSDREEAPSVSHRLVMMTSRYSLGTTRLPSLERFMRTINACRSLCSSCCFVGSSAANAFSTGP